MTLPGATTTAAVTAATSAIAMLQGAQLGHATWHDYANNKGFGMLEAYQELASLAAYSERVLALADLAGLEHPGVYAYEVDEPAGKLYGDMVRNHIDTIEPCDLGPIKAQLSTLSRNFFMRSEANVAEVRRSALRGSTPAASLLKDLGL